MGALADTDRGALGRTAEAVPSRPRRAAERRRQAATRHGAGWNVLTEELVPFLPPTPPPSKGAGDRPGGRTERARAPRAVAGRPAAVQVRGATAVVGGTTTERVIAPIVAPTPLPARQAAGKGLERSSRIAPRSRGLRRLVPGAATLAVLVGAWFGAGALSSLQHPTLRVPAGAVKISGGYRYVARPGDTLWSIASKLEPGADPRILVADLEQQLHGAPLVAGDQLKLP